MIDKDIDFKTFCEKYFADKELTLTPWQQRVIDFTSKGEVRLIFDPRGQTRVIKKAHREFMQSFCHHAWQDDVWVFSPDSREQKTVCFRCQKVKDD